MRIRAVATRRNNALFTQQRNFINMLRNLSSASNAMSVASQAAHAANAMRRAEQGHRSDWFGG